MDEQTGYRYYSTRQFEALNTLRYLRMLDMPLDEIGNFMRNREIDRIQALLQKQKEAVIRKQEELRRIERKIDLRLSQFEDTLSSEFDTIKLVSSPPGRIVRLPYDLPSNAGPHMEEPLIQLERDQGAASIFLGKVGVGIRREALMEGRFDRYDMVFLLLDPEDEYSGAVEALPEELCVALRFHGSHSEAKPYYQQLLEYMTENKLLPSSFSREITLIDSGITGDLEKFVTEIRIPVTTESGASF